MLAAGGLIALIMAGFLVEGLFASNDETDGAEKNPGAVDASDLAEAQDDLDPPFDASGDGGLSDILFGDEGSNDGEFPSDDGVADLPEDIAEDPAVDEVAPIEATDIPGDLSDNDPIHLGAGDIAAGGVSADIFHVTTYVDQPDVGAIAAVQDFQTGFDRLILEFDGTDADAPEISFDTQSDEGNVLVLADGVPVTLLTGITSMHPQDVEVFMNGAEVDGNSSIDGGSGDDTIIGNGGDDTLDGYAGDDLLDGGTGDDLLRGRAGMDSLFGSGGDDAITGGIGGDFVAGGDDSDIIHGNEGDDTLGGDAGVDEIYGDDGNDSIDGGADADFLSGGIGDDTVDGGSGNDLVFGDEGDDLLAGGAGNDFLQGGFGADTLDGGAGDDRLDGTFSYGNGVFGPFDQDQSDHLIGGDGDDTIALGKGDVAIGGAGADVFATGHFVEPGATVGTVQDFDTSEDMIEIMYDPSVTPDPEVSVEALRDGTGTQVIFNGDVILNVEGTTALTEAHLQLRQVPLMTA